jgi:hypothetical protein
MAAAAIEVDSEALATEINMMNYQAGVHAAVAQTAQAVIDAEATLAAAQLAYSQAKTAYEWSLTHPDGIYYPEGE